MEVHIGLCGNLQINADVPPPNVRGYFGYQLTEVIQLNDADLGKT